MRAAHWDGFCPAKVPDEHGDGYIKPDDIRAIKTFIEAHRSSSAPFDLAAGGHSPDDDPMKAREHVESYKAAGAIWWIKFVLPEPGEGDQALTRIKQGPPK